MTYGGSWGARPDRYAKGPLLERLILLMLRSIPGFEATTSNRRSDAEEIDVVVRNEAEGPFWSRESPYIFVECKNWSSHVNGRELLVLLGKMDIRFGRCKLGIFIAPNGFTSGWNDLLTAQALGDRLVLPIDGLALASWIAATDRSLWLRELHDRIVVERA